MSQLARRRRRHGVHLCAAALVAAGAFNVAASAQDDTAAPQRKIDPKADEAVKKMVEHYKGAKAVACKLDLQVNIKDPGGEMGGDRDIESAYTFAAQKPNQIAVRLEKGEFGVTVVGDGTTLYLYSPSDDIYMKSDSPADLDALRDEVSNTTNISQAGAEGRLILGLMMDDGYDRLLEGVDELAWVGSEKVGETQANRIKLVRSEDVDLDLFVAADGKPWLLKVVPDVQKIASSMGDPRTIDIAVTMSDWKDNVSADAFMFNVPESATLFDPNEEPLDGTTLVDKPAPELILTKLGSDEEINLADHKGKDIVVIDFWATWCNPCVQGLPIVSSVTKEYADKNVVFYAVNLREKPDVVQKFMEKKNWDFNVLMDAKGKAGQNFGVGPIPHSVIVSKDGVIEAVHIGIPADLEELRKQLKGELDKLIADGKL